MQTINALMPTLHHLHATLPATSKLSFAGLFQKTLGALSRPRGWGGLLVGGVLSVASNTFGAWGANLGYDSPGIAVAYFGLSWLMDNGLYRTAKLSYISRRAGRAIMLCIVIYAGLEATYPANSVHAEFLMGGLIGFSISLISLVLSYYLAAFVGPPESVMRMLLAGRNSKC